MVNLARLIYLPVNFDSGQLVPVNLFMVNCAWLIVVESFKCWMAGVNFLCEKVSEIFTKSGVVVLQHSDTS